MICGFILAKKGEKISKSKSNNEMEPKRLIADHSADVLRYWTAGARLGSDTFFSLDELAIPKRFITKLWNAAKFAISHLQDHDTSHIPELLPVDRWIMERVHQAAMTAAKLLFEYEIGSARHAIDELFWKDFCDNYVEIVKKRLYEPEIHGHEARRSAQHALYYALLNILKLYAIYVPHITEYIYQQFFRQREGAVSIHLTRWAQPVHIDDELILFGERLKAAISDMRKYKTERNLSMRAEMEVLEIRTEERFRQWFLQSERDIRACSAAARVEYAVE